MDFPSHHGRIRDRKSKARWLELEARNEMKRFSLVSSIYKCIHVRSNAPSSPNLICICTTGGAGGIFEAEYRATPLSLTPVVSPCPISAVGNTVFDTVDPFLCPSVLLLPMYTLHMRKHALLPSFYRLIGNVGHEVSLFSTSLDTIV